MGKRIKDRTVQLAHSTDYHFQIIFQMVDEIAVQTMVRFYDSTSKKEIEIVCLDKIENLFEMYRLMGDLIENHLNFVITQIKPREKSCIPPQP